MDLTIMFCFFLRRESRSQFLNHYLTEDRFLSLLFCLLLWYALGSYFLVSACLKFTPLWYLVLVLETPYISILAIVFFIMLMNLFLGIIATILFRCCGLRLPIGTFFLHTKGSITTYQCLHRK